MSAFAAAAFGAGLVGGVHCAGMCGGIVGSLALQSRGPLVRLQLAFNAARIGAYALAGIAVGSLGAAALTVPMAYVQITLLALANGLIIALGLHVAGLPAGIRAIERAGAGLWRRLQPFARRFLPIDSMPRALGAGFLWGWVPCGLVYSMLVLAMASGSAVEGAQVMIFFGLGTLPTLLAAGLAAQHVLSLRRSAWIRRAHPRGA
jgi:uncharacterized protein